MRFLTKHGLVLGLIVVLWAGCIYFMLNDISGSYQGGSPLTGPIQLRIERDGHTVSGVMTVMNDTRLDIADGRLLDNGSIELSFQPPKSPNPVLSGRIGKWREPSFVGKIEPVKLSGFTRLELNTLSGTFSNGDKEIPLRLSRSMAADFFRTLWWERK